MKQYLVYILIILAGLALLCAAITARFYSGGGAAGIAWFWGGIEYQGSPGLFLCPADGYISPAGVWIRTWTNPLYGMPALDSLFTDC